jgi:hypothetical protein
MTAITCRKTGVWILDDAYKKVLSEYWEYNAVGDPGVASLWAWGAMVRWSTR